MRDLIRGEIFSQPGGTLELLLTKYLWAGDIEAWGRGIRRIFTACRDAGSPRPRIEIDGGDVWVEFPFSAAYLEMVGRDAVMTSGVSTTEVTTEVTPEVARLVVLLVGEMTRPDRPRSRFQKYRLAPLGRIIRERIEAAEDRESPT